MDWFLVLFLVFIFGLCVGSFLNVLVYRLPSDLSILGRSFCPKCKKKLQWIDLIPVFSFLFLKGKCRYCRSPISWQYPIVELTTAIMFLFTVFWLNNFQFSIFNFQNTVPLVYYLFLISCLIAIFFTDLKYGIIPDKIVYPAIVISLIFIILKSKFLILNFLISAISAFLFFLILMLGTSLITKREGMGFGDVKLAFLIGLFLGFPKIIIALYSAFLTGALISLILLVLGKKKFFWGTIPFGPFLVIGTLIALFWGENIIQIILRYGF